MFRLVNSKVQSRKYRKPASVEKLAETLQNWPGCLRHNYAVSGREVEESSSVEGVDGHSLPPFANYPHLIGLVGGVQQVGVNTLFKVVLMIQTKEWPTLK